MEPGHSEEVMNLHANTVTVEGRGLLILGSAGRGKSELSLQLMAYGALLVADDRTLLSRRDGMLIARAPGTIRGLIEMRGIGILAAEAVKETRVALVLDLDREERERLPPVRAWDALGISLPLLHRTESIHFAAGLMQYLRAGRHA